MQNSTLDLPAGAARRVKVDMVVRMETALNHPAAKVWPYLLHWNLWVDRRDYVEERVAGTPDAEGEIKRITHFD